MKGSKFEVPRLIFLSRRLDTAGLPKSGSTPRLGYQRVSGAFKWLKNGLITTGILLVVIVAGLVLTTRWVAFDLVTHQFEERPPLVESPVDFGLAYEEVTTKTEDGLELHGWYLPGDNGATVMILHGTPGGRQDGLFEAAFLNKHGYNVLLASFRAHDESDGVLIGYGFHEQKDVSAWHRYLLGRADADPDKIGIFGESMGAGAGILYTAQNEEIKALVSSGALAISQRPVRTMVELEIDPPPLVTPLLAALTRFWMERAAGLKLEDLDNEAAIGQISPRPVLILQGENEDHVTPATGQCLYDAAGEPKELWIVPEAGHVNFEEFRPDEYEERVVTFLDRYLLGLALGS